MFQGGRGVGWSVQGGRGIGWSVSRWKGSRMECIKMEGE